jgi:hypothetical protein
VVEEEEEEQKSVVPTPQLVNGRKESGGGGGAEEEEIDDDEETALREDQEEIDDDEENAIANHAANTAKAGQTYSPLSYQQGKCGSEIIYFMPPENIFCYAHRKQKLAKSLIKEKGKENAHRKQKLAESLNERERKRKCRVQVVGPPNFNLDKDLIAN